MLHIAKLYDISWFFFTIRQKYPFFPTCSSSTITKCTKYIWLFTIKMWFTVFAAGIWSPHKSISSKNYSYKNKWHLWIVQWWEILFWKGPLYYSDSILSNSGATITNSAFILHQMVWFWFSQSASSITRHFCKVKFGIFPYKKTRNLSFFHFSFAEQENWA